MIRADTLEFCPNADAAPSAPGAYILQIDLAEAVLVSTARQPPTGLLPGRYFYCGSANGPGGLRSRLARHMRHGKSLHWHIDQLTERGAVTGTWIVRDERVVSGSPPLCNRGKTLHQLHRERKHDHG
jgi:Uri superfamily endonuclease